MNPAREGFERWKEEHGNPGESLLFRRELDRLINVHGYSMTDIAVMLGISRERVRQYVEALDIEYEQFGSYKRIWDDEQNRFVLCGNAKDYLKALRKRRGKARKRHRERRNAQRRQKVVGFIRDFHEANGRAPTATEVGKAVRGISSQYAVRLANYLQTTRDRDPIGEILDSVWREAGFERPDGRTLRQKED